MSDWESKTKPPALQNIALPSELPIYRKQVLFLKQARKLIDKGKLQIGTVTYSERNLQLYLSWTVCWKKIIKIKNKTRDGLGIKKINMLYYSADSWVYIVSGLNLGNFLRNFLVKEWFWNYDHCFYSPEFYPSLMGKNLKYFSRSSTLIIPAYGWYTLLIRNHHSFPVHGLL